MDLFANYQPLRSQHADKRIQQRAMTDFETRIVLVYGDRTKVVGRQAIAVTLTSRAAWELAADGTIPAATVSRLSRLIVVVNPYDETIITVAWLHGRKSRAYTRGAIIH